MSIGLLRYTLNNKESLKLIAVWCTIWQLVLINLLNLEVENNEL